jgi:uncharacterized protein
MNCQDLFPPHFVRLANTSARELLDSGVGIQAAVLATIDGFEVAAAISDRYDASRIAALASSIASIGNVATQEAGLGSCSSVILNTEQGFAVVSQTRHASHELVLIAVADKTALLAQIMYQANQYVKKLATA